MRPKSTPNDPDRRARIVAATITLIERSGITGVTARGVAMCAGVPVGSVSYYFTSVRELLLEASRSIIEQRVDALERWRQDVTPDTVIDRLAALIHHQISADRDLTVVAYELYVLGLRDPEFRAVSQMSIPVLRSCLEDYLTPDAAAHLAAVADGFQLESLFETEPPSLDRVRAVFHAALFVG